MSYKSSTLQTGNTVHMHNQFKKELGELCESKSQLTASDYLKVINSSNFNPSSLAESFKVEQSKRNEEVDPEHVGVRAMVLAPISDINFLRKEFTYTKLKYSRSPQYDAVSGGFAALLAGFIGFLISEKFGIELVDSGDFFIGFMYALFVGFTGRLLLVLTSDKSAPHFSVSPRHNLIFAKEIVLFWLNKFSIR